MVVNPKVVDINKIKDYTDLADPSLKGKVCLRNRKSPYNQSLVANQIVNKGESETKSWLSGMISNVSQPFSLVIFQSLELFLRKMWSRNC